MVVVACTNVRIVQNFFSETKNTFMEAVKKPISFIWQVIHARVEGVGLNATCRIFKISKNTLLDWERKFSRLYQVLFIYSLVHEFVKLVIEGDEVYTKVQKNTPADQSAGWTIVLMDRASRFIWQLSCGKKDQRLFKKVIKTLAKIVDQTKDITLLTDGERRYGNLLFEICSTVIKAGHRGRPRRTLKKGVKARVKNKGSQAQRGGRKRPRYQSPWPEHPETDQSIENNHIHANHLEAFFSALRRKCSAYRRKTNTYAKSTHGLQRILNVFLIVHNFIQTHFTIKQIPAVALGIIKRGLLPDEILHIQLP